MSHINDVIGDGISDLSIIDSMGDDESIVRSARVSFSKDCKTGENPEGDAKLIKYLATNQHFSPFEQTSVTFHVACPVFIARQWHRHWSWRFSEVSRRYTSEDIRFYTPREWRVQNKAGNKQGSHESFPDVSHSVFTSAYEDAVRQAYEVYRYLLTWDVANEQARMVLPQSLYTRFYATCNIRSAAHFINLRADAHAQEEIRLYAESMREQLRELFPVSIAALCDPKPEESYWSKLWKAIRG